MRVWGLGLVVAVVTAAATVSAQESASAGASVLLVPPQGTTALRTEVGPRVLVALGRSLEARGFYVLRSKELIGQAIVACQTPECTEQALDAADAAFAIVPAIWSRESGGEEITLTLVQRSGRSLNATGMIAGDLFGTTDRLVEELLDRRAIASTAAGTGTEGMRRPNAWKAGPIVLIAGGAGAIVAIGVAAAVTNENQQLNTSAAAAWAVIGAAAIGGGLAWWVVGAKRRREKTESAGALGLELAMQPSKIDLRLRF